MHGLYDLPSSFRRTILLPGSSSRLCPWMIIRSNGERILGLRQKSAEPVSIVIDSDSSCTLIGALCVIEDRSARSFSVYIMVVFGARLTRKSKSIHCTLPSDHLASTSLC